MDQRLAQVKEVHETKDIDEANEKLANGWICLETGKRNGELWVCLGRIGD